MFKACCRTSGAGIKQARASCFHGIVSCGIEYRICFSFECNDRRVIHFPSNELSHLSCLLVHLLCLCLQFVLVGNILRNICKPVSSLMPSGKIGDYSLLSEICGPLLLWCSAVACFNGPSFSLWMGWSEAEESEDSLATRSKMLDWVVSSDGC